MGVTDIVWYIYGYSLAFSGDKGGGIIGDLKKACLYSVSVSTPFDGNPLIPEYVFFVYQMMFAIITPALVTGAFANRVHFKAYLIFLIGWLTIVYIPWVHWLWGGGFMATWGCLDFAGGIVVHTTAGMAALASVFFVGARKIADTETHSIPLVALGTGLLWFGWYGFNAGSELAVNDVTAQAFLNTDLAASTAAVTWMLIDYAREKKPKFLGLLTGSIAGLATITPAAGYVPTWAGFLIGIAAAIACYIAVYIKNRLKWDDALDVWGVHGVGGMVGIVLLGCFASLDVNPKGSDGLFFGNAAFFGKQVTAAAFGAVWAFGWTYVMLYVIDFFTPVRITEDDERDVDLQQFGEQAYSKPRAYPDGLVKTGSYILAP